MATLPYWNNDEVISSEKLNSMVQAIINGDPLSIKVSNATKNDVNQIISYLSSLHDRAKTNLNSATSTGDFDTAYTNMTALVSNKLGSYANDDTVDLYSTGIRASIITFLQAYDNMMSNDRLNNKNADNTLNSRIDNEAHARSDADTSINNSLNAIKTNGGGRNLLPGTRDFNTSQREKVTVTNGQETFQAITGTASSDATYYDIVTFNSLPLEKDTDYTASFWVKTSEDTDIQSYLYDSGSNGNYADGATVNHATTDYTRVVVHFHNGNNSTMLNFIPVRINKKSTITVWLYGCMLEKGMVAHDWQPAPEDLVANTDAKINRITNNFGGQNLVSGTGSEYAMGYGIPTTTWQDDCAYLKLPTNTTGAPNGEILPQGINFYYTMDKGTTYTQTVWFETDATVKDSNAVKVTWFTVDGGHDWQPATVIKLGENRYKLYSTYTWPGKTGNWVRLFDIIGFPDTFDLKTGTYLKFGKLKLEEGVVSTAWSPAPEDILPKLDDNTVRLDNLVTSGRNYIKNSKSIVMTPNGTDNYDVVWYLYNDAFASNTYCHGNNKTRFSFYLTPSKALPTARTYMIYWKESPWTSFGTITVPAGTTDTQYYELAMTTPTNQPIAGQLFIRFMAQDTSDISYTITNSMLTIGDSFPDWQPAPEDADNYTSGSNITLPNNSSIVVKDDRITPRIYLPTYFTDYTSVTELNSLATIGELDNVFVNSATMATLTNRPTNPDTNAPLTGDCFYTNHYAYSGTTVRAFQKLYSCDYNYVFIRSYNSSSQSWTNWSCLTPYA